MSSTEIHLETRPAWDCYQKVRALASGGVGQCFLAKSVASTNDLVVIKRIFIDTAETLQLAQAEIHTMRNLPAHSNTLKILDAFIDRDDADQSSHVNIVLEYAVLGDLDRFMAARRQHASSSLDATATAGVVFTPQEVVYLTAQLFCALRHLHSHKVVHRDVKPMNICLDFWWRQGDGDDPSPGLDDDTARNQSPQCLVARLLSKRDANWTPVAPCLDDCNPYVPCSICLAKHVSLRDCVLKLMDLGVAKALSHTNSLAMTTVGTVFWLAPEMADGTGCNAAADVFAAGIVTWEMCAGGAERLFGGDNMLAVVRAISACKIKPLPEQFQPIMPLIESVVCLDPTERLSADQVLKRFFASSSSSR